MTAGQDCRLCPRLAGFRDELRERYPSYHNSPVNALGAESARLLIVGLAPGLHGAIRACEFCNYRRVGIA